MGSKEGEGGDGDGEGEGGKGEEFATRGLGGVKREPFILLISQECLVICQITSNMEQKLELIAQLGQMTGGKHGTLV